MPAPVLSPLLEFTEIDIGVLMPVQQANQAMLDIEAGTLGQISLAMADADVTPTTAQLKNFIFLMTGTNTAIRNVILPTTKRHYYFANQTTPDAIIAKTSGGAGVAIPPGGEAWVRSDGTNIVLMLAGSGVLLPVVVTSGASYSPPAVIVDNFEIIVRKGTGSATAIDLPAGVAGMRFTVKDGKGDAATNNITVMPASGTIDGAASYVINVAYGSATFSYDGTQWNVL